MLRTSAPLIGALGVTSPMPLPIADLKYRLSAFTERVAQSHTYESAMRLLADETANEQVSYEPIEGESFELTFLWEVLGHEEVEGKVGVRIFTHVCDDRAKGKLGSVWTPLCGGGWLYEDGSFEQHPMGNLAASDDEE